MNIREIAEKALNKPSPYGPDVEIENFIKPDKLVESDEVYDQALKIGSRIGFSGVEISKAPYLQVDEKVLTKHLKQTLEKYGVIVLPIGEALKKFDWVRNYYWKLIPVDLDKYTAAVELYGLGQGYFIYVPKGVKVPFPVYTCLFIYTSGKAQLLHNIIVVDDYAELHVVTGCAVAHGIANALHVGISEFYIGKNAKLTFTMLHAWAPGVHVRPRTGVYVSEGGTFIQYYVLYSDVASIQMFPKVILDKSAYCNSVTTVIGWGNSIYDIGSEVELIGNKSSTIIMSRLVGKDNVKIISRARIIGKGIGSKGHIECLGLPLTKTVSITTIPELKIECDDVELTHEAAIGKISEDELIYLMSRGLSEDEAKMLIVKGFVKVTVPELPNQIKYAIDQILKLITEKAIG